MILRQRLRLQRGGIFLLRGRVRLPLLLRQRGARHGFCRIVKFKNGGSLDPFLAGSFFYFLAADQRLRRKAV